MKIEKNIEYKIKGKSKYFKKKYGTYNPIIKIEGTDKEVFGGFWGWQKGNPACMFFGIRTGLESVATIQAYYGKIGNLGELVDETELEDLKKKLEAK